MRSGWSLEISSRFFRQMQKALSWSAVRTLSPAKPVISKYRILLSILNQLRFRPPNLTGSQNLLGLTGLLCDPWRRKERRRRFSRTSRIRLVPSTHLSSSTLNANLLCVRVLGACHRVGMKLDWAETRSAPIGPHRIIPFDLYIGEGGRGQHLEPLVQAALHNT